MNTGLPWGNLCVFGIGQNLEICFGTIHPLLMVMAGLYLPAQGVQRACSCRTNAKSQCLVGFVFVVVCADGFVRILKHGRGN